MTEYPLYIPELEHDACGIGFLADVTGRPRRDVVTRGLTALARLAHRGAPPALATIDGCGVLTAIPWTLARPRIARARASTASAAGRSACSSSPRAARAACARSSSARLREHGAVSVAWRLVPIDAGALADSVRATAPEIHQAVIGFARPRAGVEIALLRARLAIEQAARDEALAGFAVVSLSTKTVVYKALRRRRRRCRGSIRTSANARFESPFIMFHQRFSTNTSADWALAQPFRMLAHNGEINTIAGNRLWMRARAARRDVAAAALGGAVAGRRGTAPTRASLDEAIDLLRHHGYSPAARASRGCVPPAWERDRDLPPDVRAFYEFQSLVSEPWDGPSALVFCRRPLRRRGARPQRLPSRARRRRPPTT